MENLLETMWAVINSPAGITAMASMVLWGLNRLYASHPAWVKYEGSIIEAVKFAEKSIPDDVENKGLRRFDIALQYVLKVFREVEKRDPKEQEKHELAQGISIVHSDLEKGSI